MTFFESSSRSISLFEHDLRQTLRVCPEGKPVSRVFDVLTIAYVVLTVDVLFRGL